MKLWLTLFLIGAVFVLGWAIGYIDGSEARTERVVYAVPSAEACGRYE